MVDMKTGRGENLYSTYSSSSYRLGDGVEAFDEDEAEVDVAFLVCGADETRLFGRGGMMGFAVGVVVVLLVAGLLVAVFVTVFGVGVAAAFAGTSRFGDGALGFETASGLGEPCFIGATVGVVAVTFLSFVVVVFGMAPVSFGASFLIGVTFGAGVGFTRTFPTTAPGFVPVVGFGPKMSNSSSAGSGFALSLAVGLMVVAAFSILSFN